MLAMDGKSNIGLAGIAKIMEVAKWQSGKACSKNNSLMNEKLKRGKVSF